ncbi:unnamed protein product [Discula destructiva]
MPPRRSHKKSRAGCKRCKARKIKCDEVHPRCGNCLRHGVPCDFESPEVIHELHTSQASSSPSSDGIRSASFDARQQSFPPLTPQGSDASSALAIPLYRQPAMVLSNGASHPVSRLTELRLMHQYTHFTHKTLSVATPEIQDSWGVSVPSMAFAGNQQLMDAILAISALHIRSSNPNDKDIIRASHAYMASCLTAYTANLATGITADNAASMFLTASLIALQSTASRLFTKDEGHFALGTFPGMHGAGFGGHYQPPLAWFHSFQGVKTIVAASWSWLKESEVILSIIDAQPVLNLNFTRATEGFFGHLLRDMHDEVASLYPCATSSTGESPPGEPDLATSTRQAYQHAVATLNWAYTKPGKAALAFPATVSKRFVELVEERQPRALAILASFFALLKVLDHVWWLQGMARREVLGIVSLFNSDYFGPDIEKKWWPHLEWAVRIALYDTGHSGQNYIPADVWGSVWNLDTVEQAGEVKFTNHIEMLSEFANPDNPRAGDAHLPPSPEST